MTDSASSPLSSTASSGALEKTHLRVGFVALADAAPLVVAKLLEFGHAHGLTLELVRQPSWAAVRDRLLSGELDAAHALYGLVYGIDFGIGGPQKDMAVLMVLNRNGQAITLSTQLADALAAERDLPRALRTLPRKPVFAHTFPTGTHALWLYYWLASQGVHPLRDVETVAIPPPQMAAALAENRLDGLCVGEPWNLLAEAQHVGRTARYTSEIWPDHPEKVLACRRDFVATHPNTSRALIATMLEAGRWLDGAGNRDELARWLARPEWIGIDAALIAPRLAAATDPAHPARLPVKFFEQGTVNVPHVDEGVWFISQYLRWGLIDVRDDFAARAAAINQTALYAEAAARVGVTVPTEHATATFIDGRTWDGGDPLAFAGSFPIRA